MLEKEVIELLASYFAEIDRSVEKLSHQKEERLTGLPSWVLSTRRIAVAHVPKHNIYLIRVEVDEVLDHDVITFSEVLTDAQLREFIKPFGDIELKGYFTQHNIQYSDVRAMMAGDVNAVPMYAFPRFMADTSADILEQTYSPMAAKTNALELWNLALIENPSGSFLANQWC